MDAFPESSVREQQVAEDFQVSRQASIQRDDIVHRLIPQGNVEVAPGKDHAVQRGLPLSQALNQIVNCGWQKFRVELALAEDGSDRDAEVSQVESVKATTAVGPEGAHREQCFENRDERVRAGGLRVPRSLFAASAARLRSIQRASNSA